MLVLGDKVRESALGQSLLQRLHELYHKTLPFDNPYTGKKCSSFSNFASLNNPNILLKMVSSVCATLYKWGNAFSPFVVAICHERQ